MALSGSVFELLYSPPSQSGSWSTLYLSFDPLFILPVFFYFCHFIVSLGWFQVCVHWLLLVLQVSFRLYHSFRNSAACQGSTEPPKLLLSFVLFVTAIDTIWILGKTRGRALSRLRLMCAMLLRADVVYGPEAMRIRMPITSFLSFITYVPLRFLSSWACTCFPSSLSFLLHWPSIKSVVGELIITSNILLGVNC